MKLYKIAFLLSAAIASSMSISQELSDEDNATWMALKCGSDLEDRINPETLPNL